MTTARWLLAIFPLFLTFFADGRTIRTLVIRSEFPNRQMSISDSVWLSRFGTLQDKLNDYWVKHSYCSISEITAEYTNRLTLPENFESYRNVHTLRDAMETAAQGAGFIISDYEHVILSYPGIPHNISFGALGTPGIIWLPGSQPFDGGYIHEFGHALGVGHANAIEAEGVPFPGSERDGRDGLFMMGSDGDGRIGDFSTINLPMRYLLEFVDDSYVETATRNGVYRIYEFERATLPESKTLGVRLNLALGEFWISFAPLMSDRWANNNADGFSRGVIVQQLKRDDTNLLDFTPGSQGSGNTADFIDSRDGALEVGSAYTFPNGEATIRPLRVGNEDGWRWIEVEIFLNHPPFVGVAHDIGNIKGGSTSVSSDAIIISAPGSHAYLMPSTTAAADIQGTPFFASSRGERSRWGVMIRESPAANSPYAFLYLDREQIPILETVTEVGGAPTIIRSPAGTPSVDLRLRSAGGVVRALTSSDNKVWTSFAELPIDLGPRPEFGIAAEEADAPFLLVASRPSTTDETIYRFDFGESNEGETVEDGFTGITPEADSELARWTHIQSSLQATTQTAGSLLNRDYIFASESATLSSTLVNGIWEVELTVGHPTSSLDKMVVSAESGMAISDISTNSGEFKSFSFVTMVSDGVLDLQFDDAGGANTIWAVSAITMTRTGDIVELLEESFDDWKISNGIDLMSDDNSDLDGDGQNLLSEYAFDTNPHRSDKPSISIERSGSELLIEFPHPRTQLQYEVRLSDNLVDWEPHQVSGQIGGKNRYMKAIVETEGNPNRFIQIVPERE